MDIEKNMRSKKMYKALYFDLGIKELKLHYSKLNPKGAYRKIKRFLVENNFLHEQYSGYHSQCKMTDMDIFDLVKEMNRKLPWLIFCTRRFEVADLGVDYDLMTLFGEFKEEEQ